MDEHLQNVENDKVSPSSPELPRNENDKEEKLRSQSWEIKSKELYEIGQKKLEIAVHVKDNIVTSKSSACDLDKIVRESDDPSMSTISEVLSCNVHKCYPLLNAYRKAQYSPGTSPEEISIATISTDQEDYTVPEIEKADVTEDEDKEPLKNLDLYVSDKKLTSSMAVMFDSAGFSHASSAEMLDGGEYPDMSNDFAERISQKLEEQLSTSSKQESKPEDIHMEHDSLYIEKSPLEKYLVDKKKKSESFIKDENLPLIDDKSFSETLLINDIIFFKQQLSENREQLEKAKVFLYNTIINATDNLKNNAYKIYEDIKKIQDYLENLYKFILFKEKEYDKLNDLTLARVKETQLMLSESFVFDPSDPCKYLTLLRNKLYEKKCICDKLYEKLDHELKQNIMYFSQTTDPIDDEKIVLLNKTFKDLGSLIINKDYELELLKSLIESYDKFQQLYYPHDMELEDVENASKNAPPKMLWQPAIESKVDKLELHPSENKDEKSKDEKIEKVDQAETRLVGKEKKFEENLTDKVPALPEDNSALQNKNHNETLYLSESTDLHYRKAKSPLSFYDLETRYETHIKGEGVDLKQQRIQVLNCDEAKLIMSDAKHIQINNRSGEKTAEDKILLEEGNKIVFSQKNPNLNIKDDIKKDTISVHKSITGESTVVTSHSKKEIKLEVFEDADLNNIDSENMSNQMAVNVLISEKEANFDVKEISKNKSLSTGKITECLNINTSIAIPISKNKQKIEASGFSSMHVSTQEGQFDSTIISSALVTDTKLKTIKEISESIEITSTTSVNENTDEMAGNVMLLDKINPRITGVSSENVLSENPEIISDSEKDSQLTILDISYEKDVDNTFKTPFDMAVLDSKDTSQIIKPNDKFVNITPAVNPIADREVDVENNNATSSIMHENITIDSTLPHVELSDDDNKIDSKFESNIITRLENNADMNDKSIISSPTTNTKLELTDNIKSNESSTVISTHKFIKNESDEITSVSVKDMNFEVVYDKKAVISSHKPLYYFEEINTVINVDENVNNPGKAHKLEISDNIKDKIIQSFDSNKLNNDSNVEIMHGVKTVISSHKPITTISEEIDTIIHVSENAKGVARTPADNKQYLVSSDNVRDPNNKVYMEDLEKIKDLELHKKLEYQYFIKDNMRPSTKDHRASSPIAPILISLKDNLEILHTESLAKEPTPSPRTSNVNMNEPSGVNKKMFGIINERILALRKDVESEKNPLGNEAKTLMLQFIQEEMALLEKYEYTFEEKYKHEIILKEHEPLLRSGEKNSDRVYPDEKENILIHKNDDVILQPLDKMSLPVNDNADKPHIYSETILKEENSDLEKPSLNFPEVIIKKENMFSKDIESLKLSDEYIKSKPHFSFVKHSPEGSLATFESEISTLTQGIKILGPRLYISPSDLKQKMDISEIRILGVVSSTEEKDGELIIQMASPAKINVSKTTPESFTYLQKHSEMLPLHKNSMFSVFLTTENVAEENSTVLKLAVHPPFCEPTQFTISIKDACKKESDADIHTEMNVFLSVSETLVDSKLSNVKKEDTSDDESKSFQDNAQGKNNQNASKNYTFVLNTNAAQNSLHSSQNENNEQENEIASDDIAYCRRKYFQSSVSPIIEENSDILESNKGSDNLENSKNIDISTASSSNDLNKINLKSNETSCKSLTGLDVNSIKSQSGRYNHSETGFTILEVQSVTNSAHETEGINEMKDTLSQNLEVFNNESNTTFSDTLNQSCSTETRISHKLNFLEKDSGKLQKLFGPFTDNFKNSQNENKIDFKLIENVTLDNLLIEHNLLNKAVMNNQYNSNNNTGYKTPSFKTYDSDIELSESKVIDEEVADLKMHSKNTFQADDKMNDGVKENIPIVFSLTNIDKSDINNIKENDEENKFFQANVDQNSNIKEKNKSIIITEEKNEIQTAIKEHIKTVITFQNRNEPKIILKENTEYEIVIEENSDKIPEKYSVEVGNDLKKKNSLEKYSKNILRLSPSLTNQMKKSITTLDDKQPTDFKLNNKYISDKESTNLKSDNPNALDGKNTDDNKQSNDFKSDDTFVIDAKNIHGNKLNNAFVFDKNYINDKESTDLKSGNPNALDGKNTDDNKQTSDFKCDDTFVIDAKDIHVNKLNNAFVFDKKYISDKEPADLKSDNLNALDGKNTDVNKQSSDFKSDDTFVLDAMNIHGNKLNNAFIFDKKYISDKESADLKLGNSNALDGKNIDDNKQSSDVILVIDAKNIHDNKLNNAFVFDKNYINDKESTDLKSGNPNALDGKNTDDNKQTSDFKSDDTFVIDAKDIHGNKLNNAFVFDKKYISDKKPADLKSDYPNVLDGNNTVVNKQSSDFKSDDTFVLDAMNIHSNKLNNAFVFDKKYISDKESANLKSGNSNALDGKNIDDNKQSSDVTFVIDSKNIHGNKLNNAFVFDKKYISDKESTDLKSGNPNIFDGKNIDDNKQTGDFKCDTFVTDAKNIYGNKMSVDFKLENTYILDEKIVNNPNTCPYLKEQMLFHLDSNFIQTRTPDLDQAHTKDISVKLNANVQNNNSSQSKLINNDAECLNDTMDNSLQIINECSYNDFLFKNQSDSNKEEKNNITSSVSGIQKEPEEQKTNESDEIYLSTAKKIFANIPHFKCHNDKISNKYGVYLNQGNVVNPSIEHIYNKSFTNDNINYENIPENFNSAFQNLKDWLCHEKKDDEDIKSQLDVIDKIVNSWTYRAEDPHEDYRKLKYLALKITTKIQENDRLIKQLYDAVLQMKDMKKQLHFDDKISENEINDSLALLMSHLINKSRRNGLIKQCLQLSLEKNENFSNNRDSNLMNDQYNLKNSQIDLINALTNNSIHSETLSSKSLADVFFDLEFELNRLHNDLFAEEENYNHLLDNIVHFSNEYKPKTHTTVETENIPEVNSCEFTENSHTTHIRDSSSDHLHNMYPPLFSSVRKHLAVLKDNESAAIISDSKGSKSNMASQSKGKHASEKKCSSCSFDENLDPRHFLHVKYCSDFSADNYPPSKHDFSPDNRQSPTAIYTSNSYLNWLGNKYFEDYARKKSFAGSKENLHSVIENKGHDLECNYALETDIVNDNCCSEYIVSDSLKEKYFSFSKSSKQNVLLSSSNNNIKQDMLSKNKSEEDYKELKLKTQKTLQEYYQKIIQQHYMRPALQELASGIVDKDGSSTSFESNGSFLTRNNPYGLTGLYNLQRQGLGLLASIEKEHLLSQQENYIPHENHNILGKSWHNEILNNAFTSSFKTKVTTPSPVLRWSCSTNEICQNNLKEQRPPEGRTSNNPTTEISSVSVSKISHQGLKGSSTTYMSDVSMGSLIKDAIMESSSSYSDGTTLNADLSHVLKTSTDLLQSGPTHCEVKASTQK